MIREKYSGPARTAIGIFSFCFLCAVGGETFAAESADGGRNGDGNGDEDETRPIPTIYVDGLLPSDINNTPGAAHKLTDEEIAALRPYTLHDLFDFVPGIRTIDDDVLGRRSGIGVRGAPPRRSRKTLLLEDGTPVNLSTYLDASSHYTPPMERLESVDVLKGAGHIIHGPLNNHGIVNFRNKQPTETPETNLELVGGSLDTFKRHLMHRRSEGPVGIVLSYTGANADGSFDIEEFEYHDIYGSLDWNINERHDLAASLTYFKERSNYDESNLTPSEYAVAPRTKAGRFGQEHNTFALNYFKADLLHNFDINSRLSMSSRLFATDADRPRFTVEPEEIEVDALPAIVFENPEDEFIPGVQGIMLSRDRYYRTYGAENRMEFADVEAFGFDHLFQWGVRVERHLLNDMRSEGAPGELLRENHRGPKTQDVAYQATAASFFFQDIVRQGDWTVTPGLRAEYYTQSRDRKQLPLDPGPHGPREDDSNSLLLPSISVLYAGLDGAQVFANLARGYTPAPARTAEDFPLEPETGINSQLGIRTDELTGAVAGLSLEAAVFYNRITDTIVQLPFSIEGRNIVLNSADSKSWGIDLGAGLETASRYDSPFNAYVQFAYNYTQAEFTEDAASAPISGNRVPEIPRHAGSLTFGLEHSAGWQISATVSHFDSFFTDPLNTREFVLADEDREPVEPGDYLEIREPAVLGEVPGHTVISARASYSFPGSNTSIWLQGRNLSDKLYVTDVENGLRPGSERTLVAGVRINF